jgi:hypothetical protein
MSFCGSKRVHGDQEECDGFLTDSYRHFSVFTSSDFLKMLPCEDLLEWHGIKAIFVEIFRRKAG